MLVGHEPDLGEFIAHVLGAPKGSVRVRKASISGIDPAVIENLKHQRYSLGNVPLYRKIEASASDVLQSILFTMTPTGEIGSTRIGPENKALLARVANLEPARDASALEGQALAGLWTIIGKLGEASAAEIEGDDE